MGAALRNIEAVLKRNRLAEHLTPFGYDNGVYILRSGFGILFECNPIPYAGATASKALESLFTAPRYSDDWYLSMMMYASPDISNVVNEYYNRKSSNTTNIDDFAVREIFNQRKEFYKKHTTKPLFDTFDLRVRDFRLFFSIIIPFKETNSEKVDIDKELQNVIKTLNSYMGTLQGAGFQPRNCPPEEYIRLMRELVNRQVPENVAYNPNKELREHIVDPGTKVKIQENGDLHINKKPHRVYSVKDYPPEVALFDFGELLGSFTDNMKQIPTPFAICLNMRLPNVMKQKDKFLMKSHWTTQQADGNPVAKYIPALNKRFHNFRTGLEMYDQGKVQTPMQLSLWIQGDDEQHLEFLGQFMRTLWMQKNFTIKEENDETALPAFLSTLPLQYDHFYENFLKRSEPLFSCNAANMSPITSDWKGGNSPFMTLISRRGQLMSFNPYISNGNYNICVVAESGSGKSVFTNEMVCSVLAEGGKVFIIDIGRSYEKLSEQISGEFIEFDPEDHMVLNPFTKAKIEANGNISSEEFELLIPLAGTMLGMNFKASQDEKDPNKKRIAGYIEKSIGRVFKKLGHTTCWGHVIDDIRSIGDELANEIADAFFPFSWEGRFSPYVNGPDTFDYEKDLVVLELDNLEQKEDLRSLFLMMMLYRISQDIFLSFDRKKMVVLDEAWSLMRDNLSASFIEKAFRRFRKHNAAACVITQTIMDFYENKTTEAIFSNSEWKVLLKQKPDVIERAKRENKIDMHDYFFELLKTVHTSKGKYSEMMILGGSIGIGRLVLDRYSYYIYTTDAGDKQRIKNVQEKLNCDVKDAINHIIAEEVANANVL